jgi:metal-dependent amidase/aminoacylase/carboxypeptidase family protein
MIKQKIQQLAKGIFNEVVANRRHLHSHPELSFHETKTSAYVAAKLDELGIPYQRMADNGLVGLITGAKTIKQCSSPARRYGCAAYYRG